MRYMHFTDTHISTWFERDRANVSLIDSASNQTILEFWDDDVRELIEDGFLNPRDWHRSLFDYAVHLGIISTQPMPFRIHFSNFGYWSQDQFETFADALAKVRAVHFQATIHQGETMLAAWCPLGGLRRYVDYIA